MQTASDRQHQKQMQVESTEYEFENRKSVILVIGVNGVGKTTSVGKLAGKLKDQGKRSSSELQIPSVRQPGSS